MADLKSVWLLETEPVQLLLTVYRGNLVYRVPKTRKRISYRMLKKAWSKRTSSSGSLRDGCRFSPAFFPESKAVRGSKVGKTPVSS